VSELKVRRSANLHGSVRVPGDKSITHRAYLLAAMAEPGVARLIREPLLGEDCENTREIIGELGADADYFPPGEMGEVGMAVVLPPTAGFTSPALPLDCGNSGTTMRFLCGILSAVPGLTATLTGDESLSRRPMARVTDPLREMGARIEGSTAPLRITGSRLQGRRFTSPVASAQVKSCLLLAGLRANGETWVTEPSLSRDHTERMLEGLGVEIMRDRLSVGVVGGQTWGPLDMTVPADISSAAFWMVAAACLPGAEVTLEQVGLNPTRTGVLDVLEMAGVDVDISGQVEESGEPAGVVKVRAGRNLAPFEIQGDLVPRLIDEIPVLAVLATQCAGRTVVRDASELRVKESDRLKVVADGLRAMGADVRDKEDGFEILGPRQLKGTTIDAAGDHRIGMSFAIAGLLATGETTILNADSIQTSYPSFAADLGRLTS